MPPKAKKDKKISKKIEKIEKIESESSNSESEQSNLSDIEFPQKGGVVNKNNEEVNNIHGGNEDDDNLVDYDEAQGDDEEGEVEGEGEGEVEGEEEDDGEEEGDGDGKESVAKNDEMKDDDDDDCVYRVTKNGIIYDDDDDDEDEDNFFEDDIDIKNVYVTEEDRITTRKLTKYERVNIIGTRAKQIELGAQRMLKDTKGMTPKQIAKLELEMKVCPIIIKRKLPSGAVELVDVNTLNIVN
jgi:DNA-directed RNA polymerase subunit K/omega